MDEAIPVAILYHVVLRPALGDPTDGCRELGHACHETYSEAVECRERLVRMSDHRLELGAELRLRWERALIEEVSGDENIADMQDMLPHNDNLRKLLIDSYVGRDGKKAETIQ